MDVVELINKYGFPIVMAVGMGWIIKYVWEWCTKEVKPVIGEANTTLVALIDRIRMLDNDLIRLNQKVNTVLHLRGKIIEGDRVMEQVKVEREASDKFNQAVSHSTKKDDQTFKRRDDIDEEDKKTAASGEG
jgi:uncharacterized protein YoxC